MQSLTSSHPWVSFTSTIHINSKHFSPNKYWRQHKPLLFPPLPNLQLIHPKPKFSGSTAISLSMMAKPKFKRKETKKPTKGEKQYWLLKTEPGEWSWDDQAANGGLSKWDGVKNKQAINNLKSMRLGDLCFFYHSGSKARSIVGVVIVVREWYEDGGDGEGAVDVKAVGEMKRGVDLKEMKGEGGFKDFGLIRQPRLSVVPVEKGVWDMVCELGGGYDGDGNEVDD